MTAVPATYKAYVYECYGPADVLKLKDVPTLPLPSTSVRIKVHSAALNPGESKLMEIFGEAVLKKSPSVDAPFLVGYDAAGVIVEVGADVTAGDFQLGDEVYAMSNFLSPGSLAEYVSVEAQYVARKPTSIDFTQAAALPVVATTSYQAIVDKARLTTSETLLVLGGTTSTGLFAIQYAKSLGASVIATTSTKNVAFLKEELGVDRVVDYTQEHWRDVVVPHSVDVVYDCLGDDKAWDAGAQYVLKKQTGRFVTLGHPPENLTEPLYGATHSVMFVEASGDHLREIAKLVDGKQVKPVIDSTFSFERDQVVAAFARLKTNRAVGKVVIQVA